METILKMEKTKNKYTPIPQTEDDPKNQECLRNEDLLKMSLCDDLCYTSFSCTLKCSCFKLFDV